MVDTIKAKNGVLLARPTGGVLATTCACPCQNAVGGTATVENGGERCSRAEGEYPPETFHAVPLAGSICEWYWLRIEPWQGEEPPIGAWSIHIERDSITGIWSGKARDSSADCYWSNDSITTVSCDPVTGRLMGTFTLVDPWEESSLTFTIGD